MDSLYELIVRTLQSTPNVTFASVPEAEDVGEAFIISFEAKAPAPENKATLQLDSLLVDYPNGFVIQEISDLDQTRCPDHVRGGFVFRGTIRLRITKPEPVVGLDRPGDPGQDWPVNELPDDDSLEDIIQRYRKLPEAKQKIFIKFARTFLKGVAL